MISLHQGIQIRVDIPDTYAHFFPKLSKLLLFALLCFINKKKRIFLIKEANTTKKQIKERG